MPGSSRTNPDHLILLQRDIALEHKARFFGNHHCLHLVDGQQPDLLQPGRLVQLLGGQEAGGKIGAAGVLQIWYVLDLQNPLRSRVISLLQRFAFKAVALRSVCNGLLVLEDGAPIA